MENTLYYGDNLDVLNRHIKDESVDLIYLDPPFKSQQDYNILFAEQNGTRAKSQMKAFKDTWQWDQESAKAYHETVEAGGRVSQALQALRTLLGDSDMLAYLSMMSPRLVHLHRVLKSTGSLFLHCDPAASHYLKILLDSIFSPVNFKNEIILRRTGANKAKKRFGPIHQSILFYAKGGEANFYEPKGPYTKGYIEEYFTDSDEKGRYQSVSLTGPGVRKGDSGRPWRDYDPTDVGRHWQPASYLYSKYIELTGDDLAKYPLLERLDKLDDVGLIHWGSHGTVPRYKFYLLDAPGSPLQDIWAYQPGTVGCVYGDPDVGIDADVKWLSTKAKERLGYQTQKPEGVLARIIQACSKEGDCILDSFCGCGTTIVVAERLNRRWIGIDVTQAAIVVIKQRLRDSFPKGVKYDVVGEPVSLPDAKALAVQDPYQFQWWALGLVGARPTEEKKGADRGIDGRLYFHDDPKSGKTKQIIFSVKAGNVAVSHMRDLRGVVEREKAEIGVLISMQQPTQPMRKEAAGAGFYQSPSGKHPRLQILTVEELLTGKMIDCPPYRAETTFKKAKAKTPKRPQTLLPLPDEQIDS